MEWLQDASVTLPVWVVVVTGVLALWAVLDRLLLPTVRWALRRRANKAIDRLNTKLHLDIKPFKLTRRQVLIDQLLFDPQVVEAAERHAEEHGVPRDVAMHLAKRYAREIVPSFSAYAYFRIGTRIARRLSQLLYRVRVGATNDEALEKVDPNASVVFVINHRSNMDYVLVTYVAATSSALSYAVGEWAQVWPLRTLIRSMGAYFIRRDSRDALYRKILSRYVHMATRAGVVQAVFPEGGLSLDGALRQPKLGLISYMVSDFDPQSDKDVVFIPVGVNYDRVLEDRLLTRAAALKKQGKKPRFQVSSLTFIGFILRSFWLALRGRWYRYGYACVSFGEPVSLKSYLAAQKLDFRPLPRDEKFAEMSRFGGLLMQRLADTIPALPVSLVAMALLETPEFALTPFELKGRIHDLIKRLEARQAYIHIPRHDREYAIDVGVRMLLLRHLIREDDGRYKVNPDEMPLLLYYANAIAPLLGLAAKQEAEAVLAAPAD